LAAALFTASAAAAAAAAAALAQAQHNQLQRHSDFFSFSVAPDLDSLYSNRRDKVN
jgi:hypothetical protein